MIGQDWINFQGFSKRDPRSSIDHGCLNWCLSLSRCEVTVSNPHLLHPHRSSYYVALSNGKLFDINFDSALRRGLRGLNGEINTIQ